MSMRRVTALLPSGVWLTAVWVALWGDVSVANVAGGAAVAVALLVVFPGTGSSAGFVVRPVAALRFLAYFAYKLVEANIVVGWEVITPSNRGVREAIVAVPVVGASDAVVTLLANAISLTPGTLTLEVQREPPTLFVHVLHLRSIERSRADVHRLEGLALRAFGDAAAIAAHEEAGT